MDRKDSDLPIEMTEDNVSMIMGSVVTGLKNLRDDFSIYVEDGKSDKAQNAADHAKILEAIRKHEDYLVVFRVSSCVLKSFRDRDNLKIAALILAALGVDFLARMITAYLKPL